MKDLKEKISESFLKQYSMNARTNKDDEERAKPGYILEVELVYDGHFFWHDPTESQFKDMKDWEIDTSEMPERFFIKIGNE